MDELIKLDQIDEVDFNANQEDEQPINLGEGVAVFTGGGSGGITQEELEYALETKVDKTTESLKIYGTDSRGEQVTWIFRNTNNTKNTVAGRDSNGNIQVGTAVNATDAVNKEYAENNFIGKNFAVELENDCMTSQGVVKAFKYVYSWAMGEGVLNPTEEEVKYSSADSFHNMDEFFYFDVTFDKDIVKTAPALDMPLSNDALQKADLVSRRFSETCWAPASSRYLWDSAEHFTAPSGKS